MAAEDTSVNIPLDILEGWGETESMLLNAAKESFEAVSEELAAKGYELRDYMHPDNRVVVEVMLGTKHFLQVGEEKWKQEVHHGFGAERLRELGVIFMHTRHGSGDPLIPELVVLKKPPLKTETQLEDILEWEGLLSGEDPAAALEVTSAFLVEVNDRNILPEIEKAAALWQGKLNELIDIGSSDFVRVVSSS